METRPISGAPRLDPMLSQIWLKVSSQTWLAAKSNRYYMVHLPFKPCQHYAKLVIGEGFVDGDPLGDSDGSGDDGEQQQQR